MPKRQQRINVSRYQRSRASAPSTPDRDERDDRDDPGQAVPGRPKRRQARPSFMAGGVSLEALAGVSILFPFGYLAVEGIMNDSRHPLHWIIAIVAGILGFVGGQAISIWRAGH